MTQPDKLEELVVGLYDMRQFTIFEDPTEFKQGKAGKDLAYLFSGRGIMSQSDSLEISLGRQSHIRDIALHAIVGALDEIDVHYDHIVNLPEAPNAFMGAIAYIGDYSQLSLRSGKPKKDYGEHQMVEGNFKAGDKVVPIDNVVNTGLTMLTDIEPLEAADLVVPGFVAILDREEGGREALEANGYFLKTVFGMRFAADVLLANNRIRPEQFGWIIDAIYANGGAPTEASE